MKLWRLVLEADHETWTFVVAAEDPFVALELARENLPNGAGKGSLEEIEALYDTVPPKRAGVVRATRGDEVLATTKAKVKPKAKTKPKAAIVTVTDWHHASSAPARRDRRKCTISLSEESDSEEGPMLVIFDAPNSSWLRIHGKSLLPFLASIKAMP